MTCGHETRLCGLGAILARLDPALGAVVRGAIERGTVQAYNDALLVAGLVCGCGVLLALILQPGGRGVSNETVPVATPEVVVAEGPQGAPVLSS